MPKTKILIYEQPKAKVKEEPEIMCACVLARLIYNALKSNTRTVLKEGVGGRVSGYLLGVSCLPHPHPQPHPQPADVRKATRVRFMINMRDKTQNTRCTVVTRWKEIFRN